MKGEAVSQNLHGNSTNNLSETFRVSRATEVVMHRQKVKERRGGAKQVGHLLLYHIEVVSVVSLVNDVLLRFDQHLKHGVQNLRELLLRKAASASVRQLRAGHRFSTCSRVLKSRMCLQAS